MLKILIYVVLFASVAAQATNWEVIGLNFYAPDSLFQKNELSFRSKSQDISLHINSLLKEFPLNVVKKFKMEDVVVVFESTEKVDAVFMMPGFYSGLYKKQLATKNVININPGILENLNLYRLISHEFFHLMHSLVTPNEKDWIKEGLAQFFEYKVHKQITSTHVEAALSQSMNPLESNFSIQDYRPERYGNSFLFIHYLQRYCGGNELFWNLMTVANTSGRESIQKSLDYAQPTKDFCISSKSIMDNFLLSKMINDITGPSSVDTFLLWQSSTMMPSDANIASRLGDLSKNDFENFFTDLPEFLGIKMPLSKINWLNERTFNLLKGLSYELYTLSPYFPRAIKKVTSFEQLASLKDFDLILFKSR